MYFQQTIKDRVNLSGIGVHSGKIANVTIKPAPADSGIIFKRVDVPSNNLIKASYENVVETQLCTVIANESGLKVSTIEHIMSAFWGLGIDNALVEINSEEMAILDGSSAPFVDALERAGVAVQGAMRKYIKIKQEICITDADKFVKLLPSEESSIECSVNFDHPMIGYQKATFAELNGNYIQEISKARTFGFVKEIEMLKNIGLARGGSLDNAIGISETGILNPEGLRYKNEFAKHKLLDLVGDLYLAGYRIIGKIEAHKCGHHLNNMMLRRLFASREVFDIVEMMVPFSACMNNAAILSREIAC
ncbi:MAG: UDP-3-O-[3-hydroxymyristoyl] N-acetylglucosamine deacetylase [Candidatus Midichloriaceae bacterium]|jgi:UDP-3-O-[3-hydroxymyristoyl] N-acetylglucosamine deacetylase|nr:UDP-3-O-[3-hydroxymyristoyl] N-acetylglucosamine deacetylase [Candidatus Midichloriaceae bacterium]